MRRKYSIGFLIFVIIFLLVLVLGYRYSYYRARLEMEEELIEEMLDLEECFYIKESDGYVTVYFADEETVYEYTSIPTSELPESVKSELKKGKKVMNIGQVYGFLENYSS